MSSKHISSQPYDLIAAGYDRCAALEQEVGVRLLERTAFKRLEPTRILDLGCGTGTATALLKKSFRKAQVIGLDLSVSMLSQARQKSSLTRPLKLLCADMARLPLAQQSFDMVFANLSTFWSADPAALFAEVRRLLRPDGMFLFSGFGPGTLDQLADAWGTVDDSVNLPIFPDLLETGDALTAAGFREPVMDMDRITLDYPGLNELMQELESTGTSLLIRGWNSWTKQLGELERNWPRQAVSGRFPLSYEIVYGVAFGPAEGQPLKTPEGDVATFSVDFLLKSRRMGYS